MTASLILKGSTSFRLSIPVLLILSAVFTSSEAVNQHTNSTQQTKNQTAEPKQGWTSQPDGRGTWDIIWSCGLTMFLCSWSLLCLNVPAPDETRFKVLRRKIYLTVICFLGPEVTLMIALGQWNSARRSVAEFHSSGHTQWTKSHAFFADMGGFVLHTADQVSFPIDAKQLHYLITEGHVAFPSLDKRIIADKNKVDSLLRAITLCQTLWFVVNVSGRAAQHLAITCGELTTAAFIICTVGTTYCWLDKPADLTTSEIIETKRTIPEILEQAGHRECKLQDRTPLDFVTRKDWSVSMIWQNWSNTLRHLHIKIGASTRPIDRLQNTAFLEVPRGQVWLVSGVTAVYFAIFISGWNYNFPTLVERHLWRAASLTMMAVLIGIMSAESFGFNIYPALRSRLESTVTRTRDPEKNPRARHWPGHGRFAQKAKCVAAHIRNNSLDQDPALTVPLKVIIPMYVLAFFCCLARVYVFVEDVIELRSLPASAYSTVTWSDFIPHF